MLKVLTISLFALLLNSCASSSKTPLSSSLRTPSAPVQIEKLKSYANTQGCKMLSNGYMVCPKWMNRR